LEKKTTWGRIRNPPCGFSPFKLMKNQLTFSVILQSHFPPDQAAVIGSVAPVFGEER
jgi:hypothetical protein